MLSQSPQKHAVLSWDGLQKAQESLIAGHEDEDGTLCNDY